MKQIFLILLLSLLLCSCSNKTMYEITNSDYNNDSVVKKQLLIDLKGEVKFPNIYKVDEGTTLYELVLFAGGFTANANVDNINLVSILTENQMIIIPAKTTLSNSTINSLININTANISQLQTLPGIGSSKAQNIIDYRSQGGYFNSIEDVKKVSGIGEELFAKIKDYICV